MRIQRYFLVLISKRFCLGNLCHFRKNFVAKNLWATVSWLRIQNSSFIVIFRSLAAPDKNLLTVVATLLRKYRPAHKSILGHNLTR
jgi:hypothetical protein